DLVLLERHPRAAAIAGPPAGQGGGDVLGGDPHSGGHALADRDERAPVRFACGQPAEHAHDPTGSRVTVNSTPRRSRPASRAAMLLATRFTTGCQPSGGQSSGGRPPEARRSRTVRSAGRLGARVKPSIPGSPATAASIS